MSDRSTMKSEPRGKERAETDRLTPVCSATSLLNMSKSMAAQAGDHTLTTSSANRALSGLAQNLSMRYETARKAGKSEKPPEVVTLLLS